MKILITAGATREPIDGVRFLTNVSTGATGARLALAFGARGHEVTLLSGQGAVAAPGVRRLQFADFGDLDARLRALLSEESWDLVVHAAAVSDYSVEVVRLPSGEVLAAGARGKLDSRGEKLELVLRRNFKIVERLRSYAGSRPPRIVAFKLTNGASPDARAAAVAELARGPVDAVVHNDLSEISPGRHPFRLLRGGEAAGECDGAEALAELILQEVPR
jgi:phosphopantothenoylcysteine decarboxylase/phosphopantothenate--cysteine ligase